MIFAVVTLFFWKSDMCLRMYNITIALQNTTIIPCLYKKLRDQGGEGGCLWMNGQRPSLLPDHPQPDFFSKHAIIMVTVVATVFCFAITCMYK